MKKFKITHRKWLTVFSIIVFVAICASAIFFGGSLISNQGQVVFQENQINIVFLLILGLLWILGFFIYKVVSIEKLFEKLNKKVEENKVINEELNRKIDENNLVVEKIYEMQKYVASESFEIAQNNREILFEMMKEIRGLRNN